MDESETPAVRVRESGVTTDERGNIHIRATLVAGHPDNEQIRVRLNPDDETAHEPDTSPA